MAKRNLLSKLIAGIGALAMVATMMPAMSMPAEAAPQTLTVHKVGTTFMGDTDHPGREAFGGRYQVAQITKTQFTNGMSATDIDGITTWDQGTLGGAVWDGSRTFTADSEDENNIYLILKPNQYYEFPNGVALKAGPEVNAGVDGGEFEPKKNAADTRYNTWMIRINAVNKTVAYLTAVEPIHLYVKVKAGTGITAAQISGSLSIRQNAFASNGEGTEVTYDMFWDELLSANHQPTAGTHADTTNMLNIRSVDANADLVSKSDDDGIASLTNELAPANAGEKRITIRASKVQGASDMSMTINDENISKHRLVSQNIPLTGMGGANPDISKYIQLGNKQAANIATTDLRPIVKQNDTSYTFNPNGPFQYDHPIENGQAMFSIWWENLWALYFHGYRDNATAIGTDYTTAGGAPVPPGTALNRSGRMAATAGAFFPADENGRRTLTIALGATVKKGNVTFVNGEKLSGSTNLASIYNRKYVFRDENGKRFWSTEDDRGAYSADDRYYTIKGFTEGDELKFTIKIDTAYDDSKDIGVYLVNSKGQIEQNLTNAKDENGVYTVKLGSGFDYRIIADDPVAKKTREVVNEPQADARYNRSHSDTGNINLNGLESFYSQMVDRFVDWNREVPDTCNVAAPRYMLFLEAHEEDTDFVKIFPFATPRAVATTDNKFLGFNFPIGEYKFKIRFADEFVEAGHGLFDDITSNDRYGEGDDFKVTLDGTDLTKDSDGLYTLKVTEGDDPMVLKVDGVSRMYRVFAPNLAGYNIEANYDIDRESYDYDGERGVGTYNAINFRSAVPEGATYSFKITPSEGTQKGPDFKVYLRAASDDLDRDGSVVMTEIKEGADGSYSFTVYNDTEIVVSGMTGTGFNDVNNRSAEEQEAINYLKDQGVIEGYDDGSFRPGNNLTRAEFVTMLQRLQKGTAGTASFSDTASHWAAGAIGWAAGQNIVNGYPDGSFRPGESITRAEVSQIMWKLNGAGNSNIKADFSDVNQGAWYAPAVNWNYGKGIVKGYGDGRFGTNEPIERAHMALILYRAR